MDDIHLTIFTYLTIPSIYQYSMVNKNLNKISKSNILWNHIHSKYYNIMKLIQFPFTKDNLHREYNNRGMNLTDTEIIPTEIGLFDNLQLFGLDDMAHSRSKVSIIPTELCRLRKLFYVHIMMASITTIPMEIGLLTNLEELFLSNNVITFIPTTIGLLTKIKNLSIHTNKITNIPTEIGLLKNCTRLSLSNNKITSIPTTIGNLTNLNEFGIWNNCIDTFPSEIYLLTKIREFGFDHNGNNIFIGNINNLKDYI